MVNIIKIFVSDYKLYWNFDEWKEEKTEFRMAE
jgi:hypothetical protein